MGEALRVDVNDILRWDWLHTLFSWKWRESAYVLKAASVAYLPST